MLLPHLYFYRESRSFTESTPLEQNALLYLGRSCAVEKLAIRIVLFYTRIMSKREKTKLVKEYKKYRTVKKRNVLLFLRAFMPEIIFRTTKLEGESVTRKMISSLFR